MQSATAIGPLTKVTLSLAVFDDLQGGRPPQAHTQFEFIYGIGTDGLTTFEKELHGLLPGAGMTIRVESDSISAYFEHLRGPILEAVKTHPPFNLALEVLSATPATDHELVKALAQKDTNGCGCECGCGC